MMQNPWVQTERREKMMNEIAMQRVKNKQEQDIANALRLSCSTRTSGHRALPSPFTLTPLTPLTPLIEDDDHGSDWGSCESYDDEEELPPLPWI